MPFEISTDEGRLKKKVSAETPDDSAAQVKVIHLEEDSGDPDERKLYKLRKQARESERLKEAEKARGEEMKQVQFGNLPGSVVTKEMLEKRDKTNTTTKLSEVRQVLKK